MPAANQPAGKLTILEWFLAVLVVGLILIASMYSGPTMFNP